MAYLSLVEPAAYESVDGILYDRSGSRLLIPLLASLDVVTASYLTIVATNAVGDSWNYDHPPAMGKDRCILLYVHTLLKLPLR